MTTALLTERMWKIRVRERRAILGVPHLDRPEPPHGGSVSGFETPAELLQQPVGVVLLS
jgi:hypothetical protein